jgi:hypothetical protein
MKALIKKAIPTEIWNKLSTIRHGLKRANITHSTGTLDPFKGEKTFVMVVGATFDQQRPDAMMTCRMGYCHGFEAIGIPYRIIDVRDVAKILPDLPNPICMLYAADLIGVSISAIHAIRDYPTGIWVQPWFEGSRGFYAQHGMDYRIWTFNDVLTERILELEANFGFTATVPSGLHYFDEWVRHGLKMISMPLACDTKVYCESHVIGDEFANIELAFVGGYWASKGRQIDHYLRPWEKKLTIFGYSQWPYSGYRGLLPTDREPLFYRQARVCPVINEPTVALMKGQINERVFKVLGAGGCPVVDAVPAYQELYAKDELLVAETPEHFHELVRVLLSDEDMNERYRLRGRKATLERHTYTHRAREFMKACGVEAPRIVFAG